MSSVTVNASVSPIEIRHEQQPADQRAAASERPRAPAVIQDLERPRVDGRG